MSTKTPTLIKTFKAGAAIEKHRIIKHGADDHSVIKSAAATDLHLGINEAITVATDEQVDVIVSGLAPVEYGGNVTRGQKLTSDADGKAIAAAPGAGVNHQIIGVAWVSGVDGDIGSCLLAQSTLQGA